MFPEEYDSVLLKDAVDAFASLPGVGRKTALRFALHLLKQPKDKVAKFGESVIRMRNEISYCPQCGMICDGENCPICSDRRRDDSVICVVESIREVLSIENTGQYHGLYHVLGGVISPMDGIGPSDLLIGKLVERASCNRTREVILALSTGTEGETTSYYIYKKLAGIDVAVSAIARGVGFGDDLEYTDELTLGKSIENRVPFNPV
ncbi:MAG: recombination mediator RecR [Bacteroidales bacterium]|nr:recombination mediator RecR [Bacteroidales bacterium]MCI2145985.1 recombination mediator RecR [Bacteroidales bacterium]